MLRFLRSSCVGLGRLLWLRVRLPAPQPGRLLACASVLGLASLSFLAGAAVMYFHLPSYTFLDAAFAGAEAWHARGLSDDPPSPGPGGVAMEGVWQDRPDRTFDGFTLYTTTAGPWAKLVDMRGNVVRRWGLPFRKAWPHAPHVSDPLPDEQVHWFRARLFPNGDLLAVYHADGDTPYGYGLVKVDKDSNLLWAYAACAHHDVDVGDDGLIYTLVQQIVPVPPAGLGRVPGPLIVDAVAVLSPEGRELATVPVLEAFRDSPYAPLLVAALDVPSNEKDLKGDVLHANSVQVLRRDRAPKFPLFQPGQVLISLRTPSLIAVLDLRTRSVVWAARGVWQSQHDAKFLENGHILLYDNCGSYRGTRVVEYDPATQAIPWVYANENSPPFRAAGRGMKQRLPNGNTLIADPDHWMLYEVTPSKELAWEACCGALVTGACRYAPDELPFLKGEARARP